MTKKFASIVACTIALSLVATTAVVGCSSPQPTPAIAPTLTPAPTWTSVPQPTNTPSAAVDLVHRFTVVQTSIGNGGNFDGACKSELGNHWRLTDFSDIVEFHDDGGSIPDLVDSLRWNLDYGEPEFPSGEWYLVVSYESELTWNDRQYFVQRHDHHPPRNFLVHANVDNYHISGGSWYGDGWPALCYSETPFPVQLQPRATKQPS